MIEQRLSLVTLGVADLARSRAFYAALGWREVEPRHQGVAFFQLNGIGLALFPAEELAKDAGLPPDGAGFRGWSLAQNMASEAEVDRVFAEMVAAGAKPIKQPQRVFWGGYSGYVADPDGHLWELAHNPGLLPDADGNVSFAG